MNDNLANLLGALRGMATLVWAQRCTPRALIWMAVSAGFAGLLMALTIQPGRGGDWLMWVVGFYLQFLVPLACLNVCGSMIRSELQANTLSFLTTRPLRRHTIFLMQYLCHVCWLQGVFLVCTLLLFGLGVALGIGGLGKLLVLFVFTQVLAVFAWGALSALLGLLHQRYMVIGIIYWLIVEVGTGMVEVSNINQLSMLRHVHTLLAQHESVYKVFGNWAGDTAGMAAAVMMLATLFFLAAGALLFTFREYLPSHEAGQQ